MDELTTSSCSLFLRGRGAFPAAGWWWWFPLRRWLWLWCCGVWFCWFAGPVLFWFLRGALLLQPFCYRLLQPGFLRSLGGFPGFWFPGLVVLHTSLPSLVHGFGLVVPHTHLLGSQATSLLAAYLPLSRSCGRPFTLPPLTWGPVTVRTRTHNQGRRLEPLVLWGPHLGSAARTRPHGQGFSFRPPPLLATGFAGIHTFGVRGAPSRVGGGKDWPHGQFLASGPPLS